jgi:hypothetical protein
VSFLQGRKEANYSSNWNQEYHQKQMLAKMYGKKEPSYTGYGNASKYNHFGKQYDSFLRN